MLRLSLADTQPRANHANYAPGVGVTGQVFATGRSVIVEKLKGDSLFLSLLFERTDEEMERLSFISVPILAPAGDGPLSAREVIGTLNADTEFVSPRRPRETPRLHGSGGRAHCQRSSLPPGGTQSAAPPSRTHRHRSRKRRRPFRLRVHCAVEGHAQHSGTGRPHRAGTRARAAVRRTRRGQGTSCHAHSRLQSAQRRAACRVPLRGPSAGTASD